MNDIHCTPFYEPPATQVPPTADMVLDKAKKNFADHQLRDTIMDVIIEIMRNNNYPHNITDATARPEITFTFRNLLWDTDGLTEEQCKAMKIARNFFWELEGIKIRKQLCSVKQILDKAKEEFRNSKYKNLIVDRIAQRLKEEDYQTYYDKNETPHITFNWEDTQWNHEDYRGDLKEVIRCATGFLDKLPGVATTRLKSLM